MTEKEKSETQEQFVLEMTSALANFRQVLDSISKKYDTQISNAHCIQSGTKIIINNEGNNENYLHLISQLLLHCVKSYYNFSQNRDQDTELRYITPEFIFENVIKQVIFSLAQQESAEVIKEVKN